MLLAAYHHLGDAVMLAQRGRHGFEYQVALFLGVVEQADSFAGEVHRAWRQRNARLAAAGGRVDEWKVVGHQVPQYQLRLTLSI